MVNALVLTAPSAMTNPLPGTPVLRVPGERMILTSDGFSGPAGSFSGRTTDTAAGGAPMVWGSTADSSFRINGSGAAAAVSGVGPAWFQYITVPGSSARRDIEMGVTIRRPLATGNQLYLDMFRDVTDGATSTKLRALFTPTAFLITDGQPGNSTNLAPAVPYKTGDTIRLRYNTNTGALRATVNDAPVVSLTWFPAKRYSGELFGIAAIAADMSGFELDNFILAETVL